jgi:hypothetical protein
VGAIALRYTELRLGKLLIQHTLRQVNLKGKKMSVYDETISKIRQLPEPLAQEVNDFVDFLLLRSDRDRFALWTQFTEGLKIAHSDFSDYLPNLETYEERLARGEIQW